VIGRAAAALNLVKPSSRTRSCHERYNMTAEPIATGVQEVVFVAQRFRTMTG
jgi:hypothetical protein